MQAITVSNKVNAVSFEAEFLGTNRAEGMLSVHWNTNVIWTMDERTAISGRRKYTCPLAEIIPAGTHTLGFRLDAFINTTSSLTITNVSLNFIGIPAPFSLAFQRNDRNGLPVFQLTGPSGYNYLIEGSTNLVDWNTIAIIINTNGTVPFVDTGWTNSIRRFYRAVGY